MDDQATPPRITRARRRRHSKALKEQILAECQRSNVSVASVAQRHGINQNLIYKWRRQVARQTNDSFLRLPTPVAIQAPMDSVINGTQATVRIDVPMSSGQITVHWPMDQIERSTVWLKAFMQ